MLDLFIVFVLQSSTCNMPKFPYNLSSEDSSFMISMNNKGLQNYAKCIVQQFPNKMINTDIDSQEYDLQIEDLYVDFTISHFKFMKFEANPYVDIKSKRITASNTNITLQISWHLRELNHYPYTTDSGTGEIVISNSSLSIDGISFNPDDECKGNMQTTFSNVNINTNQLNFSISGGKSLIFKLYYNDILKQVNEILLDKISEIMDNSIYKYTLFISNTQQNFVYYPNFPEMLKDDRFTANLFDELNQLIVMKSGYTFNMQNISDQFINQKMLQPLPIYRNQKQIEYTVSRAALNNYLYSFHKYNDTYSNPLLFSVLEAPTVDFFYDNIIMNLKIQRQGIVEEIQLTGIPLLRNEKEITYLLFQFQIDTEKNTEIVNWINTQLQEASYLIQNTIFSLIGFSIRIDEENDCVRVIGDITECFN
ncbi:BPI-like_protein [Hexamita inflata]|uniref:BPI-like protein n=1 Tax=Hexamita inflata TaxID=28002 RepID=A0AA86USD8_9EUKA|nr:BPI-like protein [Hexamita inflata]